ncbi:uncharacterized protein LOC144149209 isoform X2 [Haemaphysalis longicornis]
MSPHPTPKSKRPSSAAANGRGNSGEGGGLRTPIKEEPVDEDTVGSTTPMPSSGDARTGRRSLEEVLEQLKTDYSEEEILELLQHVPTPVKTRLPSTPVAESTTSTCPNDRGEIPGSGARGARLSPARSVASTASICSTTDVIVLDVLDSDEEELYNGSGAEVTASTKTLNASEEKPPLGRTMVVPKTEPPEFMEPDNNPANESVGSGQYKCATDGPSSAASEKVGLSEDCRNNATATDLSTVVEKKQQQPPLGRTMVVHKTEPPEFMEPDNNPANESVGSGQYKCATDGPSSAASEKVGLSEDCRNNATATDLSTVVEKKQQRPPLGRTMVVHKTEPPEFMEPDNNPANESAGSGQYECATHGPSSAASEKVGLSEDCQNNATATDLSTVVEKKQQQGSSSTSFSPDKDIAKIVQAHFLHQISSPGPSRMMPTTSREASSGTQTTQATSKREMTANESPGSATKRLKMEDSTASANISQQQLVGVIPAHQAAIVAVKINGDFIYSSSGRDVKRHCLKDPRMCVEYRGSSAEVRSLEVWRPPKKPLQPGALYTASKDGYLQCYNTESGELTATFLINAAITCSTLAWNKIYLGLENGLIHVFNVKTKENQEPFECFAAPVHCITSATKGKQKEKFLCAVSSEGAVVVYNGSSNAKLWRLAGSAHQSPPCVGINTLLLYLTAPGQMVQMLDLQGGDKKKSFEVKCEAMGIRFHDNYAIICSAGGMLCFYRTRDFTCEVEYYTGGSTVKCIDVNGPLIATGDSDGNLQILNFDKSKFCSCKIQSCGLKFVRQDDLVVHLALAHNMTIAR